MDNKDIISTGDLELFVCGALSEDEAKKVAQLINENKEALAEVENIEKSLLALSSSFSPNLSSSNFDVIKSRVKFKDQKVVKLNSYKWQNYLGWAASLLLFITFIYFNNQQNAKQVVLENNLKDLQHSVDFFEAKMQSQQEVIAIIRDQNNLLIKLDGQQASPNSFSKIYWDKASSVVYVDASGLPAPPEVMAYQIWSIKLAPALTPTSLGLLDDFMANEQKFFKFKNQDASEMFGITLEPAGGSETPTLEQLYVIGKV